MVCIVFPPDSQCTCSCHRSLGVGVAEQLIPLAEPVPGPNADMGPLLTSTSGRAVKVEPAEEEGTAGVAAIKTEPSGKNKP